MRGDFAALEASYALVSSLGPDFDSLDGDDDCPWCRGVDDETAEPDQLPLCLDHQAESKGVTVNELRDEQLEDSLYG